MVAIEQINVKKPGLDIAEPAGKRLYGIAGIAILVTVVVIPIQIICFIAWPPPSDVAGWFALFHENVLIGLIDFDLLLLIDTLLAIPVMLAFYFALRRANESAMALAVAIGLVGTVSLVAARPIFEMLSLSNQYAAASTDAQRSILLAAGQAMLALYNGTAFNVSYIFGAVSLIAISVVMLQSNVFSRATAYMGIVANVVGLGLYIPTVGLFLSVLSVPILAVWYVMVARRLFQLSAAA